MDDLEPIEDIEAHGEPATPEALRAIVARHQRARTRALGIALAVALVAGPVAGWVVARSGEGGGQKVAIGGASPTTPSSTGLTPEFSSGGRAAAFAVPQAPAHHLFTRTTADGIAVRAYRSDPPTPPSPPIGASPSTTTPPKDGSVQAFSCAGTAPAPVPVPPGAPTPEAGVSSSSGSDQPSSASSGSGWGGSSPGRPGQPGSVSSGSASAFASSGASSSANASSPATPTKGLTASPRPECPQPFPQCNPTPSLLAELSNDAAVGQGFVPLANGSPSAPLSQVVTGMFGVAENSPAMWAAVQTGPGVKTVRLRLPSGTTDEMAPVAGVAVLAAGSPTPPPVGTIVEALDSSGKVIGTQDVNQPGPGPGPRPMIACAFASGVSAPAVSAPPNKR